MTHERTAAQDEVVLYVSSAAEDITPQLPEILQRLLNPLYAVFDFFEMPPNVIEEELTQMREGRH